MTRYPFSHDESDTSDLELLAIQERFIDEVMRGESPRLSAYLLRYPQHAAELAAFVAMFLDDPQTAPEIALQNTTAPDNTRSPGMRAALRRIARSTSTPLDASTEERRMVAEEFAAYYADAGLAALRIRASLSREEVAHRADLSPEVVAWLEAVTLWDPERARVMVARLAEALEASPEEVAQAFVSLSSARQAIAWETARASLLDDRSLTQDQRRRWRLRLRDRP